MQDVSQLVAMSIFDTIAGRQPTAAIEPAQPQQFRAVVRITSPRLSEDLILKVEQIIRLGVTPWVAAAAAGVKAQTFYNWMHGRNRSHRAFQRRIKAAHAEARMNAEISTCRTKPLDWLLKGPGRDRGDALEPGWVSSPEVAVQVNTGQQSAPGVDLSRLTIEELRAYRALTAKTQPAQIVEGSLAADTE